MIVFCVSSRRAPRVLYIYLHSPSWSEFCKIAPHTLSRKHHLRLDSIVTRLIPKNILSHRCDSTYRLSRNISMRCDRTGSFSLVDAQSIRGVSEEPSCRLLEYRDRSGPGDQASLYPTLSIYAYYWNDEDKKIERVTRRIGKEMTVTVWLIYRHEYEYEHVHSQMPVRDRQNVIHRVKGMPRCSNTDLGQGGVALQG
jgi:hypothetical protein